MTPDERVVVSTVNDLRRRVADLERSAGRRSGAWRSYVPVLGATVTPPTLGTGGLQQGHYSASDGHVVGDVFILFGSAGVAAGSGSYVVDLPVTSRRPGGGDFAGAAGVGWVWDSSANSMCTAVLRPDAGGNVAIIYITGAAGTFQVGSTTPWTWGAGDAMGFSLSYEAA